MKTSKHTLMAGALILAASSFLSCKKELQSDVDRPGGTALEQAATRSLTTAVTLNSWMTAIPDNTALSNLSIPGTHDSGARFEPVAGTAKCQTLTIGEQLNAGIRFLDIRCRHIDNAFAIHHGSVYQNLNFNDVLNACIGFLNSNPGECIIMSVKEEYDPSNNTRSFEETFDTYTQQNPGKWYLGATIPNIGQVRGKIVLLRRFGAGINLPKGIDVTNWADNTTFSINNGQASLSIQDQYVVPDNNAKWNVVTSLLNEARTADPGVMYINFTSGYKPLIFGIPSITSVSDAINPNVTGYFTTNTQGRFGIIPMDFAVSERASLIIDTNF